MPLCTKLPPAFKLQLIICIFHEALYSCVQAGMRKLHERCMSGCVFALALELMWL